MDTWGTSSCCERLPGTRAEMQQREPHWCELWAPCTTALPKPGLHSVRRMFVWCVLQTNWARYWPLRCESVRTEKDKKKWALNTQDERCGFPGLNTGKGTKVLNSCIIIAGKLYTRYLSPAAEHTSVSWLRSPSAGLLANIGGWTCGSELHFV